VPPPEGSFAPLLLTFFAAINQAFFMSLFFLVSAFFTPPSYDRKGAVSFLRDRLERLGIPLLIYFFVLNPSLVYLVHRFTDQTQQAYLEFMRHNLIREAGSGPLWFVFTLLVFTTVYVALRVMAEKPEKRARARPLPSNLQIFAFVVGVGLFTFFVRFWCPVGVEIFNLQLGYYPLYVCMYAFGVWAYRSSWIDELQSAQVNLWFGSSVVLIALLPIVMALGGGLDGGIEAFYGGASWQAYAYAAWEPVLCVGFSMKLLVVFRERCNTERRLSNSMTRSAYTAYIVHPFFVVLGTFFLARLPLDPLVKFIVLCPLAVVSCFAVSDWIRRAPLLRRVL